MSRTTTQPRDITKAIPANPISKWFYDNVFEVLRKALRVTIVDQPVDVNVTNEYLGEPPLTELIDAVISLTGTVQEVKVGATAMSDRRMIMIQPLNGNIWFGTDSSVSPTNGSKLFKYEKIWIPTEGPIYIVKDNTDVEVYVIEAK